MKKSFLYLLLIMISVALGTTGLIAQKKIDRQVIGSGGILNEKTTANWKVSGVAGQLAIEKRLGTLGGKNHTYYQGFWTPKNFNFTDVEETPEIVRNTNLANYPNPAMTGTTVRYTLPGQAYVTLKVYDVSGNIVKILVDQTQESGEQEIFWDLRSNAGLTVSSGSYMYELNVSPVQLMGSQAFSSYTCKNILVVVK